MFGIAKRKFLFKCDYCEMIISVEFDEPKDLESVENNTMRLECACEQGTCKSLRD